MRRFLPFLVMIAGSGFVESAEAAGGADRPNFVIILCDDLGYGDLACYGHPTIKTPHLDKLAAEGIRLTDCYAAAPVCSPARAGMLTGRTPNRSGVYDWIPEGSPMHLQAGENTVAALLKSAGYATCHVGKWHCNGMFNSPKQPQPGDHGFDYWFSTQNNARPSHHDPKNFVRNGEPVGLTEGYSNGLIVSEAIHWLQTREKEDRPFCLFVWFHSPHEPIATPDCFASLYPQATKRGEALYYGNVTHLDYEVGRLMAAVDVMALRDRTLVLFTSDNGPETLNRYPGSWRSHGSPGRLRGMKLHLYEGGIRVPGIIRWPGRAKPGRVCSEPVSGVDVLPTLCAIGGAKVPADRPIDGTSILPIFEGKRIERKVPLYWQYYRAIGRPKVAMRQGDWKILAHWSGPQLRGGASLHAGDMKLLAKSKLVKFELYNLAEDPAESTDLAASQPERTEAMAKTVRELYEQVKAEGPTWPEPAAKPRPRKVTK